jgi:hypothetical protein
MVNVTVLGDTVVFEVEGLDRVFALRSRVEIPLTHITGAEFDPALVGQWWHGWKLLGTDVPGLFAAGTFHYHGELVFWDVHDPNGAVTISLNDERYKKLIIEVEDPSDVVRRIRAALAR